MRSAYNYTIVEQHKQKVFIPYLGLEFSGWSVLVCMLFGTIAGVFLLGIPLSFLMGDFGYVFALALSALLETAGITLATEIDRETGKNRLMTFYYTTIKKYRIVYDAKGRSHYLSKRKEGVRYYVRGGTAHV